MLFGLLYVKMIGLMVKILAPVWNQNWCREPVRVECVSEKPMNLNKRNQEGSPSVYKEYACRYGPDNHFRRSILINVQTPSKSTTMMFPSLFLQVADSPVSNSNIHPAGKIQLSITLKV